MDSNSTGIQIKDEECYSHFLPDKEHFFISYLYIFSYPIVSYFSYPFWKYYTRNVFF